MSLRQARFFPRFNNVFAEPSERQPVAFLDVIALSHIARHVNLVAVYAVAEHRAFVVAAMFLAIHPSRQDRFPSIPTPPVGVDIGAVAGRESGGEKAAGLDYQD